MPNELVGGLTCVPRQVVADHVSIELPEYPTDLFWVRITYAQGRVI